MRTGLLVALVLLSPGSIRESFGDLCIERRGAFDISSEGIRVRVADVNTCEGRESRAVLNLEEMVPFKKQLIASGGKSLPLEVIAEGAAVLQKFVDATKKLDPKPVALKAIATGAFRQADNAAAFVKIAGDLGVVMKIITPEEEAVLSYQSVLTMLPAGSENFLVWGMGGASQQFAVRKESGKDARAKDAGVKDFETFSDPLGAVTFRAIVSQGKGRAASASPNPFTLKEIQAADAAVAKSSGVLGNASLKKLIATRGGQVVGVGGVLAESLPNQTQKTEYTVEDIDRALSERAGLTDGEIGGKYADTQTTNLILVRALMRTLGIQKVRALAVRNHAGLLTANEWWGK